MFILCFLFIHILLQFCLVKYIDKNPSLRADIASFIMSLNMVLCGVFFDLTPVLILCLFIPDTIASLYQKHMPMIAHHIYTVCGGFILTWIVFKYRDHHPYHIYLYVWNACMVEVSTIFWSMRNMLRHVDIPNKKHISNLLFGLFAACFIKWRIFAIHKLCLVLYCAYQEQWFDSVTLCLGIGWTFGFILFHVKWMYGIIGKSFKIYSSSTKPDM